MAKIEVRYDPDAWAAQTTLGRRIFNVGYRPLGGEQRGWRLLKSVPMETTRDDAGASVELVHMWQRGDNPNGQLLRVATAEVPSWQAAQQRLLEDVQTSMRPDIPPGTGKLAALGDVNLVGRDPESDVPASISFTRGNLWVAVRSVGDDPVDVGEIALRIDRAMTRRPTRAQIERGRVVAEPIDVRPRRGLGPATVIRSLPGAVMPDEWLQVIAPDGELARERNALVYRPAEPGAKTVLSFRRRRR